MKFQDLPHKVKIFLLEMFHGFGGIFFLSREQDRDCLYLRLLFLNATEGSLPGQQIDAYAAPVGLDIGKLDQADLACVCHMWSAAGADVDAGNGNDADLSPNFDFAAEGQDLVNHVLGHFSGEERVLVEEAMRNTLEAVCLMVQGETDAAMNQYNKKVVKE